MSEKTLKERMSVIEEKIDNLISINTEQHREIKDAIDRKADKWVEQVLVWLLITFSTIAVTAIAFFLRYTLFR